MIDSGFELGARGSGQKYYISFIWVSKTEISLQCYPPPPFRGANYAISLPNRLLIIIQSRGKLSKHVLKVMKQRTIALDSAPLPMKVEF